MAEGRIIRTCSRLIPASIAIAALLTPVAAMADARAYVRARAAAADGQVGIAAAGYAAAMATAPQDEVIAVRAYRNALAAGDMALARRAAAVLTRSGVAPPDAAILELAEAVRTRNHAAADSALRRIAAGPLEFLAPVLRAWVAQDRGADPMPLLDDVNEGGLSRRYIAEHRAMLLIARDRVDEGVAALRVAVGADPGSIDLRWNSATLLMAKGRRDVALSLLAGGDPVLTALRDGLRRSSKSGMAFGISRAFTRLASDVAGEQTRPLSILLTRSALMLDPADDRARLLLADALAGELVYDGASGVLAGIRRDSPFYGAARAEHVAMLRRQGSDAAALALAASIARERGASDTDRARYADMLADQGRYADAALLYAEAVKRAANGATWVQHLQLGGALERAGEWDAAVPHLRKAVELGPQEAVALNYLGYSMVERGENLSEAQAMLERAHKLRPDDAAIIDSLGWAYFRRGDAAAALPLLERAAREEPSSATINEHLGDIYWTAGRRFEARYAWRAAALYSDGEQKTRIAAKLVDGLEPTRRAAAN